MNGADIVRHGLGLILRNPGPALRISLGPVLIALVLTMVLLVLDRAGIGPSDPRAPGSLLSVLLVAGLWLFLVSWVAVAWHRYVLLEEASALLPPFRQALVWGYVGRAILITLILGACSTALLLVLGLALRPFQSLAVAATDIVPLVLWLPIGWIGFRLSLVLPAGALGRRMGLKESWAATAPASSAILLAVIILGTVDLALDLLAAQIDASLPSSLLSVISQWISTMLSLSVLTTLYGHLVERRPLA